MKKLCAVIVENRPLPNLAEIITSHMAMVPDYTDLFILHGPENEHLVKHIPHAKCQLFTGLMGEGEYNHLLTSPTFWKQFLEYERILIFQSDSKILRTGIESYYPYDYVGSPWPWQIHGGNGGISLRNPKIMYQICTDIPWTHLDGNEDVYYCNLMHRLNIGKLAPREVCENWGVESVFKLGSFSSHCPEKWLTQEQCNEINNQYK